MRNYRKDTAKYCSRSCGALFVRQEITRPCEICKNKFTHISSRSNKAKYCSRICYYESQKLKGKSSFECQHCKKIFIGHACRNRKYCCRACVNKADKKFYKASFSTVRKMMLSRGMIKQCNRCGFNDPIKILGVHHIDRNRENNNYSNLEVLCPNCHSIEHSKHINHAGKFD